MKYLINDNKTAYNKGTFIGVNARLIEDIFDFNNAENRNRVLLFLDFEKAFTSGEWEFLYQAITKFYIGENFI